MFDSSDLTPYPSLWQRILNVFRAPKPDLSVRLAMAKGIEVIEQRTKELELLRVEVRTLTRKNLEYFGVIEVIEKERDQWKAMYRQQAREHQHAQAVLEHREHELSMLIRTLVAMVNAYRAKTGEPELKVAGASLEPPPVSSEAYGKRMAELEAGMPPPIDGKAEFEKIKAS